MNKTITLFALTLFSALIVTGCSYTTQSRTISPYFDGKITHNGEPLHQVKVLISTNSNDTLCLTPAQSSLTDEHGKFSLKAINTQQEYIPFMNYAYEEWFVCVEYKQQRYPLYSNNRYNHENTPQSVILNCELVSRGKQPRCKVSH